MRPRSSPLPVRSLPVRSLPVRSSWLLRIAAPLTIACLLRPGPGATARPPGPAQPPPRPAQLTPSPGLASVLLRGVPHVHQRPDFCGEACAAMWLGRLGHRGDQDWVFGLTGVDPLQARGAYARDLAQALTRIGFRTGPGWYQVPAGDEAQLAQQLRQLHADLLAGVPSIVCMRYDEAPDTTEHFRLVLGYDAAQDQILYHEPAERAGAYRRMSRARFLSLWPLKYDRDGRRAGPAGTLHTVIRFRLEAPAALLPHHAAPRPSAADLAQHVMQLQRRLPPGFSVALAPPFVVVGDGGADAVQRAAQGTVGWAVARLKASFFPRDPDEILDVWLFRDAASYERHNQILFGEKPDTPYGYYSPRHKALIMNIATGGGTLVHEIVHPYVRANFPAAPAWLNEGLGSLYEQSAEVDGHIVGRTNWRLEGLQRAIRAGRVPSFQILTAASDAEFYEGRHSDTSYGQARYLMYYLQERGLLREFYRRFYERRREDPTGYETLKAVLGEPDMRAFQARWGAWVLGLRFDG